LKDETLDPTPDYLACGKWATDDASAKNIEMMMDKEQWRTIDHSKEWPFQSWTDMQTFYLNLDKKITSGALTRRELIIEWSRTFIQHEISEAHSYIWDIWVKDLKGCKSDLPLEID
jgi:hypothetical protein